MRIMISGMLRVDSGRGRVDDDDELVWHVARSLDTRMVLGA